MPKTTKKKLKEEHYHTYAKTPMGVKRTIYFKCQTCPSYVVPEASIGKKCRCPFCGNTFIMAKYLAFRFETTIVKRKPHCGCQNKTRKSSENLLLKVDRELKDDRVVGLENNNIQNTEQIQADSIMSLDDLLRDIVSEEVKK
jgi:hypothetical protein